MPRIPIEHVVDTTGAGDSFAAGMAFGYLQDADIVRAASTATRWVPSAAPARTLDVYLPLRETNKQIARHLRHRFEAWRSSTLVSARTTTLR